MPQVSVLQTIQSLFSQSFFLGLNFLDVLIILVILFYALEGYSVGIVNAIIDLFNFLVSFALGLKLYVFLAALLEQFFFIPQGFANAIGFFIAAFLIEVILSILIRVFLLYHPVPWSFGKLHKVLGILPALFSAIILLSFLLTLIVSLPLAPYLKQLVINSRLGTVLLVNTQGVESKLNEVFGQAVNETINFLTVKPQSDETVKLNFSTTTVTIDLSSEQKMFEMINKERTSRGLSSVGFSPLLQNVARKYSEDMFKRGYFSHYSPEGTSPFDRMVIADIVFNQAGENLALAPSVELAMQGLMNSPGHRANMLSPGFKKVGIGVIDGGIYGKMFSQEFTD